MSLMLEDVKEMILWRKKEVNQNGWNVLDLCVRDIMTETGLKDEAMVIEALKANMLEGDVFLEEDAKHTTVRFYCDNLSDSRRHLY